MRRLGRSIVKASARTITSSLGPFERDGARVWVADVPLQVWRLHRREAPSGPHRARLRCGVREGRDAGGG